MEKKSSFFTRRLDFYHNKKDHLFRDILAWIYAAILFGMNFIRIFDNNFWGDEAYTIKLAQMGIPEMLRETGQDVHPPLYYLLVKLICSVLGFRGVIFHFASLLPYMVLLLFTMTVAGKRLGKSCAVLFATLISILPGAVQYNVEVRMYSWGALFVFLSFWFLGRVLWKNKTGDYAGFVCFSLAAAYTHYYCLVSVAFFYLVLLLRCLLRRGKDFKKVLAACAFSVAGYLPWFFVLLHTFKRTSKDFWMAWIPTLKECFGAVFEGKCQYLLFLVFLLASFAVCVQAVSGKKGQFSAGEGRRVVVWIVAGFFSVFGTMAVGILVSRLIRPLFIVRYLYPVSVVAWFLLCFSLSMLKGKAIYAAGVALVLWAGCFPQYSQTYLAEKEENDVLEATLAATEGQIRKEDIILTDLAAMDWTVSDYYYPGVPHQLVDLEEFPKLDPQKKYWLVLSGGLDKDARLEFEKQGIVWETVVDNGILGTNPAFIYKLYRRK